MSSAGTVSPALPGYVINLTNPESVGYQLIICSVTMTAISSICLCLRLYTRKFLVRSWGWDDSWILLSWIFLVGLCISNSLETKYGMGMHIWDIRIDTYNMYLKLQLFIGASYIGSLNFVKLSICCLYLRLSPARTLRYLAFFLMGITATYSLISYTIFVFSCNPISASWDLRLLYLPTTHCINHREYYLAHAAMTILTDISIYVLPMPTIWNLQLPFRQKLGVSSILAIGLLVCIISFVRLKSLITALDSKDPSWDTNRLMIWSAVEANAAVVCACIATLKPFLKRFFPGILGNGSSKTEDQGYSFQSKGIKLAGGLSHQKSTALQSYYRPETNHQHTATVTSGEGKDPHYRDGDTESQTGIMEDIERGVDTKEGVTITRTVKVS